MTAAILVTLGFILLGASIAVVGYALWLGFRTGDQIDLPSPQTLATPDGPVTIYRVGRGPPLILLHGVGATSFSWRYVMPLLADHYEVIAIELPGFIDGVKYPNLTYGLDDQVERLDSCIRAMAVKPVAVVGSSLGGLLALGLARKDPASYPRIIALAPAVLGPDLRPPFAQYKGDGRCFRPLVNRITMPLFVGMVVGGTRPIHRHSIKRYLEPYREPQTLRSFFGAFEAMTDPRLPRHFDSVKVPTLVLWGERDRQVPWRVIEALKVALPHAEVRRLPQVAHHPHESHPELVAGEITAWLGKRI